MSKYVFRQLVDLLPHRVFDGIVEKYQGNKYVRSFTCWNQLLVMIFAQLMGCGSLREMILLCAAHKAKTKWLGYEKNGEISSVYPIAVSFGDKEEVTLEMHVIPFDYQLEDEHITRWDEALFEGTDISRTENYIKIISSPDSAQDKQVIIHHNSWTISGKWETMTQHPDGLFVYHCRNSLFAFDITINISLAPSA